MEPLTRDNIQALVNDSVLFQDLNQEERRAVADIAQQKSYKVDEVILLEGQSVQGLGLIVEGTIKVSTAMSPGEDIELKLLTTGAWFGEVGFMSGNAATATLTGFKPGHYLLWPSAELRSIISEHPKTLAMLKRLVLRRAEDTITKTIKRMMG